MSAHRPLLLALSACAFALALTSPPAAAQSSDAEPIDRGEPPDVLIQTDGGENLAPARTVVTPNAAFAPDQVDLLIIAAVGVIVLGLATLLVTHGDRQRRAHTRLLEPSSQAFLEASRAIHSSESVFELCATVAQRALILTEAVGSMITIDGLEADAGTSFDVPTDLVFLANRRAQLVSDGSLLALPISIRETVVGLLVVDSGTKSTLEAFGQLIEDGYASVSAREKTAALVFVDGLTGIANRRRFDADLERIVGAASEAETPVALAMFDVDHFKTFNDSNGHQAGDDVLRAVAELIASNLRSSDVVYRYGGEEFVALLPGATVDDAYEVVERIRRIVERTPFDGETCQPSGTVTMSIGIAAAPSGNGSTLVHAADMALYQAKTSGRNRVVIEASLR